MTEYDASFAMAGTKTWAKALLAWLTETKHSMCETCLSERGANSFYKNKVKGTHG